MPHQRNIRIIPRATVARILISSGAKRVSAGAADSFAEIIGQIAEDIGRKAVRLARHSGRKTVKEKDIRLAVK